MPSPQIVNWQRISQVSVFMALPSSHCSPFAVWRTPSPQVTETSTVQVAEQLSPEVVLPSSHSSPSSLRPLPQTAASSVHVEEHPSPDVTLPSSHCSLNCGSITWSPQTGLMQVLRQRSGRRSWFREPSSHCSPRSTVSSPQRGSSQLNLH